jgi:hypothetical protein
MDDYYTESEDEAEKEGDADQRSVTSLPIEGEVNDLG